MRSIVVGFTLLLAACRGSTEPTSGANIVIVSASTSGAVVSNTGGPGEFYLEAWGPQFINPPGGGVSPMIRLWHSPITQAPAGYRGTFSMGAGGATRWVAWTQTGSDFFTSSCWGSC